MKYTDEQRVQKIGETTAKLLAYLNDNAISQEDIACLCLSTLMLYT